MGGGQLEPKKNNLDTFLNVIAIAYQLCFILDCLCHNQKPQV